jgi:DNA gyrase inhibitor GyrI
LKKNWLYFLLAFAAPLVGIFWWVGGFTSARIETNQVRGPYHYAYLEHSGDYAKLPEKQREAFLALEAQGVAHGAAITLMQNDPRNTARDKLTAQTGYLVATGVSVREPLKLADVPARPVIVVGLRAHPRLAAGKAYAALLKYLKENSMKLKLPTLEIYQNSTLTVEMDI